MIDKVGTTAFSPSDEQKKIAKANNLDWDRYVREIEELKTNPPRMFEVTVPYFTWYHQAEFPAWRAASLTATGVSKDNLPPVYDKQLVVTEPYLKILQNQVPGYLKDITEIDPTTGKPLDSGQGEVDDSCSCNHSHDTTTTSSPTTTASQKTESSSQTKQAASSPQTPQGSASTTATKAQSQPTATNTTFDFTKLSPAMQETALRLAEQLLSAALQRLSGAAQTNAQLSTLFDRTT